MYIEGKRDEEKLNNWQGDIIENDMRQMGVSVKKTQEIELSGSVDDYRTVDVKYLGELQRGKKSINIIVVK